MPCGRMSHLMTHCPIEHPKHWTFENILIPKAYMLAKRAMLEGEELHPAAHKVAANARN